MSRGWNGIFLIITNAPATCNYRAVQNGNDTSCWVSVTENPFDQSNGGAMSLICALVAPAETGCVQDEGASQPQHLHESCYGGLLGYNSFDNEKSFFSSSNGGDVVGRVCPAS